MLNKYDIVVYLYLLSSYSIDNPTTIMLHLRAMFHHIRSFIIKEKYSAFMANNLRCSASNFHNNPLN